MISPISCYVGHIVYNQYDNMWQTSNIDIGDIFYTVSESVWPNGTREGNRILLDDAVMAEWNRPYDP